ncbi:hypothetical protein ABZ297_26505 [Nonomuraea sp. NPDC005983]|uniref:hypothetical protein n=1 Tax=Nonomuraea sp. NPDC005983 TaxID=3155595 RepID=UPI0033A45C0C
MVGAAVAAFERDFTARTAGRLGPEAGLRLGELIAVAEPDPEHVEVPAGRGVLQELTEDPGPLQLDTLLAEIVKLERVRAIGLPDGLFEGVSEKVVEGGGPARRGCTPPTSPRRPSRSGWRCWRRCAGCARPS